MPDIKKYSTGKLGNSYPLHENTDHINTRGLDKGNIPGIEAYIDEDIVRAYDDNRPLKNLLINDELVAGSIDCLTRTYDMNAFMKNRKEDWSLDVGNYGYFVDPEDFSRQVNITPLKLNVSSAVTEQGGLTHGSPKKIAGFERDNNTTLWINDHDWYYTNTPTVDDPDASYTGYYRPVYEDASISTFPEGYEDYKITIRQRYTTGAVYTYDIYSEKDIITPLSTSIFNINNEIIDFKNGVEFPGYDTYPESFVKLKSNNMGQLEIGEDTELIKDLRREEHKLLANEFNAESGAFKAELKSDVFRENKSNDINRIENDTDFINTIRGISQYNKTSKVYFNDHKTQAGALAPLEDNRDFLGSINYSFEVEIDGTKKIIELESPETRAYQDLILEIADPSAVIIDTSGQVTYNFNIKLNNEVGDPAYTPTEVNITVEDFNLYELIDAINDSFNNNSIYAEAELYKNGPYYDIRIYSRSSGDYSKIEITSGTSDLISNLDAHVPEGYYDTPVDGQSNWYIYYDPSSSTPETPPADVYRARRIGGTTTINDFNTGYINIGNQIFNELVSKGFNNFEVGVNTYPDDIYTTKLYIMDTNSTNGYIELNMSVPVPSAESGLEPLKTYSFMLDVDDGGYQEYNVTTTTDTTYIGIINTINSVIRGIAQFSIEPSSEIRITSDTYGKQSVIKTADGVSNDSLFGAAYPAAGFTPSSLHAAPQYGTGRDITLSSRIRSSFTTFTDLYSKRVIYSQNDPILYITPDTETDKRDHIDTLQAFRSIPTGGNPYERWSTHNDRVIQINLSTHSSWTSGATITEISEEIIDGIRYLLVGNTAGQVYFLRNNKIIYHDFFDVTNFTLLASTEFANISTEKINKFFKYNDGLNNKVYLIVLSDTNVLVSEVTSGLNEYTSFIRIDSNSSLSVPNVSAPVFSELRDVESWTANVSTSVSNNYIIFVGKSSSGSTWEKAPILYALYKPSLSSSPISDRFNWYAEEIYRKEQIDDISSIIRFNGWSDPEQNNQIFIANNVNGPELWTANSQNNDTELGTAGDDRFNRFSWTESNQDQGLNPLKIDSELDEITSLSVYDNRIFIGGIRKDENTTGGLYSYAFNKLQKYYEIDIHDLFFDEDTEELYINSSEGLTGNSIPSILKMTEEDNDGRAQIISRDELTTVSNWPSDSSFRIILNGFIVGGVNFDGEYNIQFNGQGKANLNEIADAINGSEGDGFKTAKDFETGIENDITPVIRARALIGYKPQGATYTPYYKLVIESKIPEDVDAGHSSTRETTQSNCYIEIKHPTIGTTIVGTGSDTLEVDPDTVGYSNLKLVDWDNAEAYQLKRKGTDEISFSGSTYIDITNDVDTGYEILAGSLRVKTNEDDELGFTQGRGRVLLTNTPTGLANDSTKYGLKVTFNSAKESVTGVPEIVESNVPADTSSSLSGTHWLLFAPKYTSPWTEYYVWYNVNNESVDPSISGKKGIEVKIDSDSSDNLVAQKTAEAIDSYPDFTATSSGNTITITNESFGDVIDPVDGTTGITSINVTQQGTDPDPDYDVNWIEIEGSTAQTIWELKEQINSQLTIGTATLATIGATSEYCDILLTSNLIGDDSSVEIKGDLISGNINLIGIEALDLIPNDPIYGNTALNTSGSQTIGITWENADFFYENNHPVTSEKRIYIPNGTTRIDPGATVWLSFWEWKELNKIPAKDVNNDNNIPSAGEWTYDLEQKKVVVGDEPAKTFPQDVVYIDASVEKILAKLDLTESVPADQEELSDRFHLTVPDNIENSEITLARPLSRVSALDYGIKLWSTDSDTPLRSDYSFFLPRIDILSTNKNVDYYGNRVRIIKGTPNPDTPYVNLPLVDQESDTYVYSMYINSARYENNNITEVPWYSSDNLTPDTVYISGNSQLFKSENSLISTRGLKPLLDKQKLSKVTESDMFSVVRVEDPISVNFYRRRKTSIRNIDVYDSIFVDPINGNDINNGKTRENGLETITAAIAATTNRRNNIIILRSQDGTIPIFDAININRNFKINIYAEEYARVRGATVSSEVYFEGIDFTPDTLLGNPSKVVISNKPSIISKYCKFNTIQTINNGLFENGLSLHIYNSVFEDTPIIIDDVTGDNLIIEGKIDISLNHCYIKTAEVAKFYPYSYDETVSNVFEFNNITNGLNQSGYIVNTDKFTNLQFVFNKSVLPSGDNGNANFASAAPIILNESISYTLTNNEAWGTGSILSNNSQAVDQGKIDIIPETGAPISKARGYNENSAAINYVNNEEDAGAFIERRFKDKAENKEIIDSQKTYLTFDEESVQYKYELNPEAFSFHIRFKPLGNFQQQGVLFDSRYDGDFITNSSTFNLNGQDFIQIAYNNKTYGLNYLSSSKYSFKLIISNGLSTNVAVIGTEYDPNNFHEYNKWHEIAILLTNSKIDNPKYDFANVNSEFDTNRYQTIIYTMFDRYVDRVFALKNQPFADSSGNEILSSNWKPGKVLSTHFNIGKGWAAEWVETSQGKTWTTWAETNYNMLVDQYLVSKDKLPINILKDLKSKEIIDRKENDYNVPNSDNKHTILLNHCDNSHPFSDNGVEPFEDYYISFRPYEGYESHAIAIEDISQNYIPYGRIKRGQWYDRTPEKKWSTINLEVLSTETGDQENEVAVLANTSTEIKMYFVNTKTQVISDEILIDNTTASESRLKLIGNKYVVVYIDSSTSKPYFITLDKQTHSLGTQRVINTASVTNINFNRAHDDNRIIVIYRESSLGWAQTMDLTSGTIVNGRTEFADGVDAINMAVAESYDEDENNSFYIFYREATTDYLRTVMYNESLSTIILSHDTLTQGQIPVELETLRTRSNSYVIKWKDYVAGNDSPIRYAILSNEGSELVPETDVFTDSSDLDNTDDVMLLQDGNILFSSISRTSGSISFKLYSQLGDELDNSDYLREYSREVVTSIKTSYPYDSKDISVISKITNEIYTINLEYNIPTRWYKDATGEYDSYLVEIHSTKTFFGQALHMAMNHTTSAGETGLFVADAESQDLSAFDSSIETNGDITVDDISNIHGTYGYKFNFVGSGTELYTEKTTAGLPADSYSRLYINLDKYFSLTTGTTKVHEIARYGNSSDPVILELVFNDPLTGGDGNYKLRASTTSYGNDETSVSVINYSKDHYIDIRWLNDISGGWQVWVDSNLVLENIGQDTSGLGNANYISIGSQSITNSIPSIDSSIKYDDILISSTMVGPYIAGLGQGIVWTKTNIETVGEKHYMSGYYYIVSGNMELEVSGSALDEAIKIQLNQDGTYSHKTYGEDSVFEIKTDLINWNGVYRLIIGFYPDYADEIDVKVKTTNSDDDLRIDDFLVDNLKLEKNEYASSMTADATGYISYPVSLKSKGNIFLRVYPQFAHDTDRHKTFVSGVNHNESGLPYITHELYYDKDDKKIKLFLQDALGNTATLESDEYGVADVSHKITDLNEKHMISANWDVEKGYYELFIDDKYYKLTDTVLPEFKSSGVTHIGNRITRDQAANSLFDLYRVSDEPLSHIEIINSMNKNEPFQHENKTNIGNVTVKGLSFYGINESDEATIYGEKKGETSSLVLEVGKDFEDQVVIRQSGYDLAVFGAGALTINGILRATEMTVEATTTMASYDDHVTVRYGFNGVPPEYNDGYFEVERGNLTNSEIRFDESQDAWSFHDGTNNNITIDGTHIGTWKNNDNFRLVSNGTGYISLSTDSSTDNGSGDGTQNRNNGIERLKITPNETVVNEPGLNHDFRVEANPAGLTRIRENTHLLYTDADQNQVLIGRNSSDPNSGALVVNYKSTIQSHDISSFGIEEFKNDNGDRAGYIGDGNGNDIWEVVSEIQTLQLTGIDLDIILSGTQSNSIDIDTAGGIKANLGDTSNDSFRLDTVGGVQWYLNGLEGTDNFRINIASPSNNSFNLQTAGGVRFDINGTTTTAGSEDKFKVEIANTVASSFHVDTTGGARFDVDNGFYVNENTNAAFIHLNNDGSISLNTENTATDSIKMATLGGFDIDTNGAFTVDSNSGIYLTENSGSYFQVVGNGSSEIYSVNGIYLTENSGSSIAIGNTGTISLTSTSGSSIVENIDGTVEIQTSSSLTGSNLTLKANNNGNIYIDATGDDIFTESDRYMIDTRYFEVGANSGETFITALENSKVGLYYNNSEKLETINTGIHVISTINVGTLSGAQGDFQNGSSYNNAGHINTPWVYTAAIESTEKGLASTGMFMNDGYHSSVTDEILFVTNGIVALDIDSGSSLTARNNLTVNGAFGFDSGTTVNEIVTVVSGSSSNQLVTESAIVNYVNGIMGNNATASSTLYWQGDQRLTTTSAGVDIGYVTKTSDTVVRVLANDSNQAGIELYGQGQGTGYVYVGQSTSHGGGIFYNGDGTPAFATGEKVDALNIFRRTSGVDHTVAYALHGDNDFRIATGLRFGDNANTRVYETLDASIHTGTNTVEGVAVEGSLAAYKIYNAVWNDYAESFEYDKTSGTPEPGYIYAQTENGLIRANRRAHKATVGVYSDTYGMLMGSKGTHGVSEEWNKIPIGLAGVVWVYTKDKIKIGDLIVTDESGMAVKANIFERIFKSDRIIGKALENSKDNITKKVKVKI